MSIKNDQQENINIHDLIFGTLMNGLHLCQKYGGRGINFCEKQTARLRLRRKNKHTYFETETEPEPEPETESEFEKNIENNNDNIQNILIRKNSVRVLAKKRVSVNGILSEDVLTSNTSIHKNKLKHLTHEQLEQQLLENEKRTIQRNGWMLQFAKYQSAGLCKLAVESEGEALQFVNDEFITEELCDIAVRQNPKAIQFVKEEFLTAELCIMAVQRDAYALKDVNNHNQTEEICMISVRKNGHALAYVHNQTYNICIQAVQQNGSAIQYVKKEFRTPELCKIATLENPYVNCLI